MKLYDAGGSLEAKFAVQIAAHKADLSQGIITESEYQTIIATMLDLDTIRNDLETPEEKLLADTLVQNLLTLAELT